MNSIEVYTFERVAQNQCQSIDIQGIYFNGSTNNYNVINSSARNFTVSTANFIPSIGFYSDASCSANLGSNFTLPAGSVRTRIYYRINNGSSGTGTITITDSASITKVSNIDQNTGTTATSISFAQDSTYVGGTECRELEVYQIDSTKRTASWGSSSTWNLYLYDLLGTQISPAGVSFVDNCTSKNVINSVNIGPSLFKGGFALLTTNNASLADAKIFLSPVTGLSASAFMYINPVKKFDHFDVYNYLTRSYYYDTECVKYLVTAKNAANALVSLSHAMPFNIQTQTNVTVYSDSLCQTPWAAPHEIPAGAPEVFYIKSTPGSYSLNLGSFFSNANFTGSASQVYASPAVFGSLVAQFYSDHLATSLSSLPTWYREPSSPGSPMACSGPISTPATESLLVSDGLFMANATFCSASLTAPYLTISARVRFTGGSSGDVFKFTDGTNTFKLSISSGTLTATDSAITSMNSIPGSYADGVFHNLILTYNGQYWLSIDGGGLQQLNIPGAPAYSSINSAYLGNTGTGASMNVKAFLVHDASLPNSTAGVMNDVLDINNYLNSRFP
jgi:hypothetical protein